MGNPRGHQADRLWSMSTERVLRPVRTRALAITLSAVLVVAALLGWFLLPAHIRAQFTLPQILTLLGFLAIMVGIMLAVGLSSVRVGEAGIIVRNGPVTRRLPWVGIVGFRLRHGDPWAYALLSGSEGEPRRVAMLGVQATDGSRATDDVAWLRQRLAASERG